MLRTLQLKVVVLSCTATQDMLLGIAISVSWGSSGSGSAAVCCMLSARLGEGLDIAAMADYCCHDEESEAPIFSCIDLGDIQYNIALAATCSCISYLL